MVPVRQEIAGKDNTSAPFTLRLEGTHGIAFQAPFT
jgi:hypothetical protein